MRIADSLDRLEHIEALDAVTRPVQQAVQKVIARPPQLGDALHGVYIGHPLHPAIVLLPVGAFASAGILELVPRTGPAVPALITAGVASVPVAAAAGLADWAEMHPEQQRVGVVHAAANVLATAMYGVSLFARARRRRLRARLWAYAGLTSVMVGGYLGGHISYRQSGGANHAEEIPHVVPPGWHDLGPLEDLPVGSPVRRDLDGVPLFVVRRSTPTGDVVSVLSDRCSHLSGPLHEGDLLEDSDGRACVRCPWHGSTFHLDDGSVSRGPATAPQPRFDVRVTAGRVEACLPNAS